MLDFDVKLDLAEQDRCLSKLPYADGANFDSHERQNEPYCLPDTRVDILCQIMKWSSVDEVGLSTPVETRGRPTVTSNFGICNRCFR